MAISKFSNVHGTPAQRFFNVLCIAYGADQNRLPTWSREISPGGSRRRLRGGIRAGRFAFKTLIDPHIDKARAEKVLHYWIREVDTPPHRPSAK